MPAMLAEFAAVEGRDPRDYERITQLISHLMRHQFVHLEDRGAVRLIETLHRAPLARLVDDYFDVAGYRLVFRETEGWAGILPDPERVSLPRLRIDETIVLLVLRRLWEEDVQHGEVNGYGTATVTLNETFVAYEEIVAGTRRASLSISDFQSVLQALGRRSVVSLGDLDPDDRDRELAIRAIVATLAGDDFVASLDQLLARPVAEGEAIAP